MFINFYIARPTYCLILITYSRGLTVVIEGICCYVKANSHRHARHDTDRTVLSCLAGGVKR